MAHPEPLPAETIVWDAVTAQWNRVAELHLSIAEQVTRVVEEWLQESDART